MYGGFDNFDNYASLDGSMLETITEEQPSAPLPEKADNYSEGREQIPSHPLLTYKSGAELEHFGDGKGRGVMSFLKNAIIVTLIIAIIGALLYLTYFRYTILATAVSNNQVGLSAALLTPEITAGLQALAGSVL